MAGFTRTEVTVLGRMGDHSFFGAVSDTTKALAIAADTTILDYARQGDVFIVICTDGILSLMLQADGTLDDANGA